MTFHVQDTLSWDSHDLIEGLARVWSREVMLSSDPRDRGTRGERWVFIVESIEERVLPVCVYVDPGHRGHVRYSLQVHEAGEWQTAVSFSQGIMSYHEALAVCQLYIGAVEETERQRRIEFPF